MAEDLVVNHRVTVPGEDLSWTAVRASGPGGQNVNKVATKVELRFDLSGTRCLWPSAKERLVALAGTRLDGDGVLRVTSDATRSQTRNLADAREKLRQLIVQALVVQKKRRPTKPSKGAKRRRLEAKRQTSQKKKLRGKVRYDD